MNVFKTSEPQSRGPRPTLGGRFATPGRQRIISKASDDDSAASDIAKAPSRGEGRARPVLFARAKLGVEGCSPTRNAPPSFAREIRNPNTIQPEARP